ncbi:rhodanese-like domain-containing protein [Trichocoleus sp. Lan]|uniref:sulfurtransferase n=1 Tax=Trichocoleus sp. Lan TaxID=2933927 RepID=UPI003296B245
MNQDSLAHRWVVSAEEAKELIKLDATLLDVRNSISWLLGHISGAVHVTWQQFSQQQSPNKGKLIENTEILQEKLCAVGICNNQPVVVLGNPAHNFGEEGRIVWMLRTLGHSQAVFVDGGHSALVKAGVPIVWGVTQPKPGDFLVQRTSLWEIQRDELKANLSAKEISQDLIVIDTREAREYAGTPAYGEHRGGHLPGAVHFYFQDLKDAKGNLLPRDQIIDKLERLGIQHHTPIITYCTGGIRSAFFTAVLVDLGFNHVKNYAGSMWEWSASPENHYPLEFEPK